MADLHPDKIIVGERARKKLGNLKSLKASIERVGLLHPLVVNARRELIAGMRRLSVVRELGWKSVPVTVVDTLDDAVLALVAERDENTDREPLLRSEIATIGKKIEAIEKPKAAKRQANAGPQKGRGKKGSTGSGSGTGTGPGDTRDKVGEALGVGGKTYEQIKKVVTNGTHELVEAMDAGTISVKDAAKVAELDAEQQREVVTAADPKKAAKEVVIVPPAQLDAWGIPIQSHALEAFAAVPKFKELIAAIQTAQRLFNEVANLTGGVFLTLPDVSSYRRGKKGDDGTHADRFVHEGLERAYQQAKAAIPTHTVCPWNYVDAKHPADCPTCKKLNWTPALSDNVPKSAIERVKKTFGIKEE